MCRTIPGTGVTMGSKQMKAIACKLMGARCEPNRLCSLLEGGKCYGEHQARQGVEVSGVV